MNVRKNVAEFIFTIILVLCISGIYGNTVFADDLKYGDFKYSVNGDEVTITGYTGSGGNVVIPAEINGKKVTCIGEEAFNWCTSMTSVKIPDSVTDIGFKAFYWCSKITSVNLPEGVTNIDERAFSCCYKLTSINIPDSVNSIGVSAFEACNVLSSIEIPDGITNISDSCFKECYGLKTVVLPDSVTSIGSRAFYQCKVLTSIDIPDGVTKIDFGAFYDCVKLKSIKFPSGIKSISANVLCGCSNINNIDLPDGLTTIEHDAFRACSSLTSIDIPETVTTIEKYAFCACGLSTIIIPDGITEIGASTFQLCTTLTSIIIPDGVTSIGDSAFYGCSKLEDVTIPDSVKSIGDLAFRDCDLSVLVFVVKENSYADTYAKNNGITVSYISSTDTSDEDDFKFRYVSGGYAIERYLGTGSIVNVPATHKDIAVVRIWDSAFEDCDDITEVHLPDSVTKIEELAFYSCDKLKSVNIPDGVDHIEKSTFAFCKSLEEINLPDTIKVIGEDAFEGCISLKKINLNNNIRVIGKSAFSSCSSLESILIPNNESYEYIEEFTFDNCSSLTSISIPENIIGLEEGAFAECSGLTSVIIPGSIEEIEERVFSKCTGLKTVYISEGITKIGNGMFSGCTSLSVIDFPDSLRSIQSYAFSGCTSLKKMTLPDGLTGIGADIFYQCKKRVPLIIPESVSSIGKISYEEDMVPYVYADSKAEAILKNKNTKYLNGKNIKYFYISDEPFSKVVSMDFKKGSESNGGFVIDYDDNCFDEDSYIYHHDLCKMAMCFSTLAYRDVPKNEYGGDEIKENLSKIQYGPPEYHGDETVDIPFTGDDKVGLYSPFWLTHKKIKKDGKEITIVVCFVRGTKDEEWVNNFQSGQDTIHNGFNTAANRVYESIKEYYEKYNLSFTTTKLLVTGHSRGAAVSNLVGEKIDSDSKFNNISTNKTNVFVYTFATPNVAQDTKQKNNESNAYENIYNIVNPEDFVTKVMPEAWNYGRYGVTYTLPSKVTDAYVEGDKAIYAHIDEYVNYDTYLQSINTEISKFGKNSEGSIVKYEPYKDGPYTVNNYVKYVTDRVKTKDNITNPVKDYYDTNLGALPGTSLNNLYTQFLGYNRSGNLVLEGISLGVLADCQFTGHLLYGLTGFKTTTFFVYNGAISKYFVYAHQPETYLAALNSCPDIVLKRPSKNYAKLELKCPVDVTIKDKSGNIVAKMVKNQIVNTGDGCVSMSVEDDLKTFVFPELKQYTVEITGNDNGKLNYSISVNDSDCGEQERVFYPDLPVVKGETYTFSYNGGEDIASMPLIAADGSLVPNTGKITPDDFNSLPLTIKTEGKGFAGDEGNFTPGDYVSVIAKADTGYVFVGWFDKDDKQLSTDEEYSFTISKATELTAKFEKSGSDGGKDTGKKDSDSKLAKVGSTFKHSSGIYKVIASDNKSKKVTYLKPNSKKVKSVKIPASIKINGISYQVTEISANAFKNCKKLKSVTIGANVTTIKPKAFYGCKKLKKITIKSNKLNKIGKQAFKGINAKAKFKVPKKKLKKYKKMIKKAGAPKKAKVTK